MENLPSKGFRLSGSGTLVRWRSTAGSLCGGVTCCRGAYEPRRGGGALMSAAVPSATSDQLHRAPPRPRDMLPLPAHPARSRCRCPSSPSTSSPTGPSAATRSPSSSTRAACRTSRCRRSRASSTTPSRPSSCRPRTRSTPRAFASSHPWPSSPSPATPTSVLRSRLPAPARCSAVRSPTPWSSRRLPVRSAPRCCATAAR